MKEKAGVRSFPFWPGDAGGAAGWQVSFKANGRTVMDYEKRFQLEDIGCLFPGDRKFRWSMLEEELNLRFF